MELRHSYYYFKEAISPEVCKRIVDLGLSRLEQLKSLGKSTDAWTSGDKQKSALAEALPQGERTIQSLENPENFYIRDSNVAWLNDPWLYDLIMPLVQKANKDAGWNWDIDYGEEFQFTVYKPGGFYGWHKDGGSDHFSAYKRYIYGVTEEPLKSDGRIPAGYTNISKMVGKVRKISLTINLNAPGEYEGGNLKFDFGHHMEDRFHECEEIRPQGSVIVFPSFLDHCVTPVTSGTRYSLVLWCLGKPFK